MDILEKLRGLHVQATTERSHYYVASCVEEAIAEIKRLRAGNSAKAMTVRAGFDFPCAIHRGPAGDCNKRNCRCA
jgi:hypothetical protein